MPKTPTKLAALITAQIHQELHSHMIYLSMAAFFERSSLRGLAKWFRRQAAGEHEHAMKFYDFLIDRGNAVILHDVAAPQTEFKSVVDVFRVALQQEEMITKSIYAIYELAQKEKDFATVEMLNWFLKEQVEEEDITGEMLDKAKLAGDNTAALLLLDHEAGEAK